jgi:hypothetical protein
MERIVINGRSTAMGAFTGAVRLYHAAKTEWATGRTHWREKIEWLAEDGFVVVRNISNRGNHNCWLETAKGEVFSLCREEPECFELQDMREPELLNFISALRSQHSPGVSSDRNL